MDALKAQTAPRGALRWALVVLVAMSVFAFAGSAFAMTGTKLTINKQTGGQPSRITFEGSIEPGPAVEQLTMEFPEGFDLSAARAEVLTLQGLTRVPVTSKPTVDGQKLTLVFTPPIEASYKDSAGKDQATILRVQVFDVVTPFKGGTYTVGVTYVAGGQTKGVDGLTFEYATPPREEIISRALDNQAWVTQFNSVKVFALFFKPQLVALSVPLLFGGWLYSIALILFAFPLSIVGGLALAFAKMSKIAPVRWLASAYINVIRGTPLFLQMFVAFIGLPIAGVRAPLFITSVLVLTLNSSAYLSEIFRAGIQSIHKGQFEAASSLGMTYRQAMQYVIVPQTVKRVLPTMTSEFILLFKDTALLSALGVIELMYRANSIVSRTGNLTPFVIAAVYYLLITIPLINWVTRLEHRLAVAEGGQAAGENPKKGRNWWRWRHASAGPEAELQASAAEHESR